jgi:hypothetical protein
MDAVFKNVEEPQQRMFFVFPLPGMDWRTFADLCLRLRDENTAAITRLDLLNIECISEEDKRSYDFTTFVKRLQERGAP